MPSNAESNPSRTSKQSPLPLSRAEFLDFSGNCLLALIGLLGLAELVDYLRYEPGSTIPKTLDIGPLQNYPPGSRTLIPEARAVLIHSQSSFTALSLVCPHLGCTLKMGEGDFTCPCHGSRFELDGNLENGPSSQSMKSILIEETPSKRLILHLEK